MSKLPIDLKGFKKSSSDKHTTTLVHKNGHEIKLAHKALSKEMRDNLEKLPMAEGASKKSPDVRAERKEKEKAALQKFADGGQVEEAADAAKDIAKDAPGAPITINIGHAPQIPEQFNNPLAGQQSLQQAQANQPQVDAAPKLQDTFGVSKEQQAQMQMAAQQQPAAAVGAQMPQIAPPLPTPGQPDPSAAQPNQDPYGMEAYQNSLGQGIAEQKAGLLGEAQASAAAGAGQVRALHDAAQTQQAQMKSYQDHYGELDNERKSFQHDVENAHVDPKHYMSGMGTMSKIATGIGLLLGGMGSGVTGGENLAMSFLNKQIDRDIEAQKTELGKKENLLSANLKQFGNMRDATDMTRVMQNDIVMNKLKEAAAKAASPMAQAAALKAIGQLDTENAGRLQQLAVRKTMMGAMSNASQDPSQMGQVIQAMRQVSPEMAKSMEERFIPGVGMAQVPVPQSARDTIIAKQTLQQMSSDFYQWAEKHSGSVDPRIVNEGKTKAAELQSLYRNSINGGVFKKGEQEFIDQIVDSDPTKFFNSVRVLPKLKEVMNSNIAQLNTLKRGYGIQTQQIQESAPVLPGRK
jgi:hypothetical protein